MQNGNKRFDLPLLPGPVLYKIFVHLNPPDLKLCRQTCRLWNRVLLYYNLLPGTTEFYFHTSGLNRTMPPSSSQNSSFLTRFFTPKKKSNVALLEGVQWLQDQYLKDLQHYFTRSEMKMRLVGVEDIIAHSYSERPGQFLISPFLPIMDSISLIEIAPNDFDKLSNVCGSGFKGSEQFISLLQGRPNLKQLSIPVQLLCSIFCDIHITRQDWDFSGLESLEILLPNIETILSKKDEYKTMLIIISKMLFAHPSSSFQNVKNLKIMTKNSRKKKRSNVAETLKEMEDLVNYCKSVDLDKWMNEMLDWQTSIQTLHLNFEYFPTGVFINGGALTCVLVHLARNAELKKLYLTVEGMSLCPGLSIIPEELRKVGCDTFLNVVLYFDGSEPLIESQYLLSLSGLYSSVKSLTFTFLPKFNQTNQIYFLDDILPLHTRLQEEKGRVSFPKLTSFHINLEGHTHKIFFGFNILGNLCPNLKELSVIIGGEERYKSMARMVWTYIKGGWTGTTTHATSLHVFYVRNILKSLPQLESLTFWGDLRKAEDNLFIDVRPEEEYEFIIGKQVPWLKKLSMRGLGSSLTNNCLEGFRGMKTLTHLELIGFHKISNSARTKLMNELPNLHEFKTHL